jgi:hypothetical protein
VRNPEELPFHEGDKLYRRRDRENRYKQQFDEDGQVIDFSDDGFKQPLDKDIQGNVLSIHTMDINGEDDITQTPNKEDTTPAADKEEHTSPSPESQDRRSSKHDDETEKIKKLFAMFTPSTQKQLTEQAERHAIKIAAMKQTTMETQNLLTTKTMPTQPENDYRASAHFTAVTKACDVLFDGQPENWPTFKNHLLNEAENPTIGWNQELIHFQLMDSTTKPFKYFDISSLIVINYREVGLNVTGKKSRVCVMQHTGVHG